MEENLKMKNIKEFIKLIDFNAGFNSKENIVFTNISAY